MYIATQSSKLTSLWNFRASILACAHSIHDSMVDKVFDSIYAARNRDALDFEHRR